VHYISHSHATTHIPYVGFVTAYASWRMLQLLNAFFGGLLLISAFFAFPETIRPNPRENSVRSLILDPLKPLGLLRSPNLLATVGCVGSFLVTFEINDPSRHCSCYPSSSARTVSQCSYVAISFILNLNPRFAL